MRPFAPPPRKLLPVALGALLLTLLLAALWRPGDASTALDRLFQSALQPTATTGARLSATVAPTATVRGGRAAPTATPAARVLNAAHTRRLPLVLKGWPPTPTPTATATPTRTSTPTSTPTRTATPTATPTLTPIKYGWKGIADPGKLTGATTANGFWGLNPNWYYNWGFGGPWAAAHSAQAQSSAVIASQLAAALADPAYVPMIWCTDEVVSGISPETAAGLARAHPGRVWLIFNTTHAYPHSAACGVADATCLQQALVRAHNFYQGTAAPPNTNPAVTAAKPIWITEIGNLAAGGSPPGALQGRPTAQAYTATVLAHPLLTWFAAQAVPGGSVPYFNGLAWFSTHDCRGNPDGSIKDFTASDLLDIGPVACPITTQPTTQQRTMIGQAWAAAACATCACPGPDCP